MLYLAQVIDNLEFFKTKKIKVRIQNTFNSKMMFDFSMLEAGPQRKDYVNMGNLSKVGGELRTGEDPSVGELVGTMDEMAFVFTPIGGGKNYGLFTLPRINSKGVVSDMDGGEYLWMGSLYDGYSDNENDGYVNIPSDKLNPSELGGKVITDPLIKKRTTKNFDGDEESLVLRLKSTATDPNWDNNATENLIVIDKNGIQAKYIPKTDGWKKTTAGGKVTFDLQKYNELSLGDKKISISSVNVLDNITTSYSIVSDVIEIESVNLNDSSVIKSASIRMESKKKQAISIKTTQNGSRSCEININDGSVTISAVDGRSNPVMFNLDFDKGCASITARDIRLNATHRVTIGSGIYNLVATSSIIPLKVNSTVLIPLTKIKVG